MTLPAPPEVAGVSLDGTEEIIISSDENRALCKTINAEPATDGSAHPSYYYITTQIGMGKTVAGLCEACDFDVNDGPMMASSAVVNHHPLLCDTTYTVKGEISSIVRKKSRKLGIMDIVTYVLRLVDADNTTILTTTNAWVLPRRELA